MMTASEYQNFFSIIISTRNRPEIFETALKSVVSQTFQDKDIIVVVDGSSQDNLAKYLDISTRYPSVKFHYLIDRPNGHGPSYTMNFGADNSGALYLCFLDDDDSWDDNCHLERVKDAISNSRKDVDVFYGHQKARHRSGSLCTDSLWLEDLIPKLDNQRAIDTHSYLVDTSFLLSSSGFAHLNCSIFRRDFYIAIGGMDEAIRYENDRDIYLRSIDSAETIILSTSYHSVHNIPDPDKQDNVSTQSSIIEKKIYQLRVYDKAITTCKSSDVLHFCVTAKGYETKKLSVILAEDKRFYQAAHYARQALLNNLGLKWLIYTLYLGIRSLK